MDNYNKILNGVMSSGDAANLVESLEAQVAALKEQNERMRPVFEAAMNEDDEAIMSEVAKACLTPTPKPKT